MRIEGGETEADSELNLQREVERYTSFSRFTDPKRFSYMLDDLPEGVKEICAVANTQTIHHNLLGYFGMSYAKSKRMIRVWPPKVESVLEALHGAPPHNLRDERSPEHRVVGACILESHLLAGFLRHRRVPVRVRAGYFRNIQKDLPLTMAFWRGALRARGVDLDKLRSNPSAWRHGVDALTKKQFAEKHRIEHWICEYWSQTKGMWTLLDSNNTFLKAISGIEVPFVLPAKYFQHSFEAWKEMRSKPDFNPDQYAEEPQDGRSHIRSQMLSDFFNLLNHDVVGQGESKEAREFIKGKRYEELSAQELADLDLLAELLSNNPDSGELVKFYRRSRTVALEDVEEDTYSLLSSK